MYFSALFKKKKFADYNGVLVNKFVNANNSNFIDIPTSVTWINTNLNRLAAGYMMSPQINIFDKETVRNLKK